MSPTLPSGTVTFFFSDIEGSTRLWEQHPVDMQEALARHDRILRQAIESNQGAIVKTTGDGVHAAFETAQDALLAAFSAQRDLCSESWSEIQPDRLRSRMALFTGEAVARNGDYYGTMVNRAARLMTIGHGGQVLLSSTTADLVRDRLPDGLSLLDLGEHRLRDLVRPERVYQLVHPLLPDDYPPLNSLDVFPNNLPVQLTSFIGREREMTEVKNLLGTAHLVTLIGPGGTGKTRLALQAAADLLMPTEVGALFPHGVWLVEFATQVDPGMVVATVAEVFNLRETPGSPPLLNLIIDYLRAKKLLLILDNCEHLIEACARLADSLLRACPGIKILASSREAFGISGETIYRVPSLSLPEAAAFTPAALPASDPASLPVNQLLSYESIQLFVERAAAAQPRFSLNERNAPAVARICQRLDGIPLALELAASRLQVFTPEQIAARLDDRFRLLTGGSRTALHRQQTLRALIDWSYDILSAPEQALFRRLSVFTGGWTFEAAEALYGDLDVLELLSSLVNKSLVIVSEQEHEARYGFLETIRQYARDRLLEAGEAVQARDHHLDYYLRISAEGSQQISGSGSIEWLNQMDQEGENLRSAIEWGMDNRPEDAVALIGNLFLYFSLRTNLREAQRTTQEALLRLDSQPVEVGLAERRRAQVKAKGLAALGMFSMNLGEIIEARLILEKSVALARDLKDPETLQFGLGILGTALNFLNKPEEAKRKAEEGLTSLRGQSRRWEKALMLGTLAWAEGKLGNHTRRKELLSQLNEITEEEELNNPMIFDSRLMMGLEARAYGDLENARMLLERCLTHLAVIRSKPFEAMVRSELAHIQRQSGDIAGAREAYCQTLQLWIDLGNRGAIAHQLECYAFIARALGRAAQAARILGAAEALREDSNSPMTDYERSEYNQELAALGQALPEPAFSQEWSAGLSMSMEEAVAYAAYAEGPSKRTLWTAPAD